MLMSVRGRLARLRVGCRDGVDRYRWRLSTPDGLSREDLLAALAERDAVIAGLLAEIERLKRRIGMDSSNSSLPPGSDGPAARAKRAKRRSKRSPGRGGQDGHEGHHLRPMPAQKLEHVRATARCRSTLLNSRRVIHVLSPQASTLIHSGRLRFVSEKRSTRALLPFCSPP
jgi:hypothetical protein